MIYHPTGWWPKCWTWCVSFLVHCLARNWLVLQDWHWSIYNSVMRTTVLISVANDVPNHEYHYPNHYWALCLWIIATTHLVLVICSSHLILFSQGYPWSLPQHWSFERLFCPVGMCHNLDQLWFTAGALTTHPHKISHTLHALISILWCCIHNIHIHYIMYPSIYTTCYNMPAAQQA